MWHKTDILDPRLAQIRVQHLAIFRTIVVYNLSVSYLCHEMLQSYVHISSKMIQSDVLLSI